ncbi:MAG: hypothetical protein ACRBCS_06010 [Cellvibrionaceae bacterium]
MKADYNVKRINKRLTTHFICHIACLPLFLFCLCLQAQEGERFVSDPNAKKYALILVGASYDDKYDKQFKTWAIDLRKSLIKEYGYQSKRITVLLGNESKRNIGSDGKANANTIKKSFEDLAKTIKTNDQLMLVMFGHGSGEGDSSKYQIVGPDLTALDFRAMMAEIKTQNIVVVNTTSASHGFTKSLASPGRVLLSATRSRAEIYDTLFPHYFVEGLEKKKADRDKNDRVSVLESFLYANNKVAEYYKKNDILPSEHATLEDNDDAVFSVDPLHQNDGRIAEIAYIDVDALSNNQLSPKVAVLKSKMDKLERDIFLLRGQKKQFDSEEYWQKLEPLLIELATTTRDYHAEK